MDWIDLVFVCARMFKYTGSLFGLHPHHHILGSLPWLVDCQEETESITLIIPQSRNVRRYGSLGAIGVKCHGGPSDGRGTLIIGLNRIE